MELNLLRSFREVVRERSFTAAARNLHLTQPAVSQQVRALEKDLGARLLDRSGREVRPTPAGEVLLEAAERVLALVEDAARRVRETRSSETGAVSIACGDTVALYLLPPVLSEFRSRFPKADVVVRNHGSREILALVAAGGVDLGVATSPDRLDPAIESAPLLAEPMVLAFPPDHPRAASGVASLTELEGESAVLLARPSVTRALIERGLADAGVTLAAGMESGNLEVVKAYVARGFGLTILPRMAVGEADRGRLAVHPLPDTFPRRRLVVLRRRERFRTRLSREFVTILAEHTRPLRRGTTRPAAPRGTT